MTGDDLSEMLPKVAGGSKSVSKKFAKELQAEHAERKRARERGGA